MTKLFAGATATNLFRATSILGVILFRGTVVTARGDEDRVTHIPNFAGEVCWNQYAGYLNATKDHQLFYWYHESITSPEEKPLVLWLNGGPGCSSLGGMFTELGPFVLDRDLNITLNPFSFHKVANMLFLEQPAGVGFSYPNVPANDDTTAQDTDAALRNFFRRRPELRGRDFYVMGESYGGHYVPNTVQQIQTSNAELAPDAPDRINLRGFAVGNGYTDWQLDFNANVENGRYHALTSEALLERARTACDGEYARCFWPRDGVECPEACRQAVQEATKHGEDGTIDIYDIYNDVCLEDHQERLETQATTFLNYRREARRKQLLSPHADGAAASRRLRATISPVFPTCIDAFTQTYLNLPQVQEAIHVKPGTIPHGKWADCGNVDYDFNYESELDKYRAWTQEGDLEILIYTGDTDFILTHMGNSAWINQGLNLSKTQEWTPWRGSDGQVAGYFERYQTGGVPLTFLTVKGAGHMVPRDRPQHTLDMFEQFLGGGEYDKVKRSRQESLCTARDQPVLSVSPISGGSRGSSSGRFLGENNNCTVDDRNVVAPKNIKIPFNRVRRLHIGKAGGGTVGNRLHQYWKMGVAQIHPSPKPDVVVPDVYLMVSIRDPIDRFFSAFNWKMVCLCNPFGDNRHKNPMAYANPAHYCNPRGEVEREIIFHKYNMSANNLAEAVCTEEGREDLLQIQHAKFNIKDWLAMASGEVLPSFDHVLPTVVETGYELSQSVDDLAAYLNKLFKFETDEEFASRQAYVKNKDCRPISERDARKQESIEHSSAHANPIPISTLSEKALGCLAKYYEEDYIMLERIVKESEYCSSEKRCRNSIQSILDRRAPLRASGLQ